MGKHQANCTLTEAQLKAVLENDKTKAVKWVDLCKQLKITPNKLYGNLIYLGLRCKKQKENEQFFSWDEAAKQDYILTIKDTH